MPRTKKSPASKKVPEEGYQYAPKTSQIVTGVTKGKSGRLNVERQSGVKRPDRKEAKYNPFKDPEARKRMQAKWRESMEKARASGRWGRPAGLPDGWTLKEVTPIKERARKEAKLIMSEIKKTTDLADERAEEALEAMVEIVRTKANDEEQNGVKGRPAYIYPVKDRISAAKTVLEYTKQKPASKNEHTIAKAEDFLDAVAEKAGIE